MNEETDEKSGDADDQYDIDRDTKAEREVVPAIAQPQ
jgi:hypothetical protein